MTTEALRYLDDLGQRARSAVQQSEQMAAAIERYRHTHNIPRMAVFSRPFQPTPQETAMLGHLLRKLQTLESRLTNDHYIAGKAFGLEGICPVCNRVSPVNGPPCCSHMEETQTDREESITNTAPQNPSGPEGGAEAWLEVQQNLLSPVETVGQGGDAFRAMGIALHHIGAGHAAVQNGPGKPRADLRGMPPRRPLPVGRGPRQEGPLAAPPGPRPSSPRTRRWGRRSGSHAGWPTSC